MERWCYRPSRIGVLVGPSQGLVREIQTHFPLLAERAVVIHNGVDRDVFSPQPDGGRSATRRSVSLPDDALVAIFVGGDWARKGLGKIISALRSADDWYLIVVGDGDLQTYRSLAEACGLLERVRFVGPRLDVAALYSAADAFVFPSDYEAAASGLPLLLSRINGAEELLEEGHNGWFVASAEEIASRLTQLSADRSMLARMGVAARESTRAYTWTYMAARYAELYESLDRRVKR
jgi:UDP-glucose:(heptosyl)LPS alpha-1,3-glucosyltransferase